MIRLSVARLGMAAGTLAAVFITGCGSSSNTTSKSTSTSASTPVPAKIAAIAAQVPASIKKKGTLVVAADATYPPNESIASDGHTVIGMDADLANALAAVMGLKANVVNQTFATIIPGIQHGKYDMGASSFTDTKARQKVVDFVTYYSDGTSFFTKAQGGPTVNTLADLCGHTVAMENGTTQQTDAAAQNKKCKAAGKGGVSSLVYNDQNAVNLAVESGKAQIGMGDSPVVAYSAKRSNGVLKVVGQSYGFAPYGFVLPKGNGMAKPVLAAVKSLMADGTYMKILKKWAVQAGAITSPKINGAIS
jgi:polar amino acid transport system substrate-binding protein